MTFNIAKIGGVLDRVKTPLTLGGLVVIVLYAIYSQILNLKIFPQLPAASAFIIVQDIIRYLFWLALLAVVLGVGSYLMLHFITRLSGSTPDPKFEKIKRTDTKP